MNKKSLIFSVIICVLGLSIISVPSAGCFKPNPDAIAKKKVEEALRADTRLNVEELTITVEKGQAKVTGEVGSQLHPQIITEILERLKSEGVIQSYLNLVTVMEVENPLMQDYTAPLF